MSPAPAFAASRLVNPPGVTPTLSVAQVWAGLDIKARKPQTFVPTITACELVKDEGNKIERRVRFGDGPFKTELIESHAESIVYFEHEAGFRIVNLVSYNDKGELLLTYSFANGIPMVEPGEELSAEDLNARVGAGVEGSIRRIRELVVDGAIV